MFLRKPALCIALLVMIVSSSFAGDKTQARLERVGDMPQGELRVRYSLITADTCYVSQNEEILWRINGWVTGMELYKSLMDPAASCDGAYPFTITEINMPMIFDDGTPIMVSVDVEAVDYNTVPGCPQPGVVLALSQDFNLEVPAGGGLFNIWIPLDSPLVVNEPFFAGFYIGNAIDPAVGAAVMTDSVPVACATFNIWEGAEGWVDLADNSLFNFPGRLAMEVSGIPGGSSSVPAPQVVLLSPSDGDALLGSAELWAYDSSGSSIIDYILFEYSTGGPYIEIGRDFDGYRPIRDGVSNMESGAGLSFDMDLSLLPEGTGTLRATLYDTLGQSSETSITVLVEPSPPIPVITSPDNGDDICPPTTLVMSCADDNMSFVEVYRLAAALAYSADATPMSQESVGDNNGNTSDGNLAINGEFGTYYCGPVAATVALKIWADRGISGLVSGGNPMEAVAETLAEYFDTRTNMGTYDEDLYLGLAKYSRLHGDNLEFDFKRNPDYYQLRAWVEDEGRVVILGLSGNPALFVTVDGFEDWNPAGNSHTVLVANPASGTIQQVSMRDNATYSEIQLNGTWQRLDIMISVLAKTWTVSHTALGVDFNGADGWSFNIPATGLVEDSLYFIRAKGQDATLFGGSYSILIRNNCSDIYAVGDYNNDGATDIGDIFVLVDLITMGGQPPVGGLERADANCDGNVDVVDVVYYMNYLFGGASPPCH
jgi:hypothetical protein